MNPLSQLFGIIRIVFLALAILRLLWGLVWWMLKIPLRVIRFFLPGRNSKADLSELPEDGVYRVEYICDGDTINVTNGSISFRVRLAGIDAPEKSQPFGRESTDFLKALLPKDSLVYLAVVDYDSKWDRVVAYVENEQEVAVNLAMVEHGFAYYFKDFAKDAKFLSKAEKVARKDKRGLWALNLKEKPWDYRQKMA